MRRPIVYVAGPYSGGDPVLNTRTAVDAARRLWGMGFLPHVPHLTLLWHAMQPESYDFWLDLGMRWVERSDLVLRLPGESPGADREVELAGELGIPVVSSVVGAYSWLREQRKEE